MGKASNRKKEARINRISENNNAVVNIKKNPTTPQMYNRTQPRMSRKMRRHVQNEINKTYDWAEVHNHAFRVRVFLDNFTLAARVLFEQGLHSWVKTEKVEETRTFIRALTRDYKYYIQLLDDLLDPIKDRTGRFEFTLEAAEMYCYYLEQVQAIGEEARLILEPSSIYIAEALDEAVLRRIQVGIARGAYVVETVDGVQKIADGEPSSEFPPVAHAAPTIRSLDLGEATRAYREGLPIFATTLESLVEGIIEPEDEVKQESTAEEYPVVEEVVEKENAVEGQA